MSGEPVPGCFIQEFERSTVKQTGNPTMGRQFRKWRRIYAILAASGFLVGAVGDVRPCPHHELLPASISAQCSTHGEPGNEPDYGLVHAADQRDATSDVHACLCVDICEVDTPSETKASDRVAPAPVDVVETGQASAIHVFHSRPTAVLIPQPNAPPGLA
jgi:hypothetical protein